MRTLVVNADDFGFTRDVNSGIVQAHVEGILTATTLMAGGAAFDDAVRLADENPRLDVGIHLQMVQGQSLSRPGDSLPGNLSDLLWAVSGWDVVGEFRAQVEKVLAAGIRPLHLDTHKHTHLLPPVLEAVASVSREYRIPWIRRPFDLRKNLVSHAMSIMHGRFERVLKEYGCRSTNHFSGFVLTGKFTSGDLTEFFRQLPEGITEFMCHPGHLTDELRQANTRLKESRALELQALIDPVVRAAIDAEGIRLIGYKGL